MLAKRRRLPASSFRYFAAPPRPQTDAQLSFIVARRIIRAHGSLRLRPRRARRASVDFNASSPYQRLCFVYFGPTPILAVARGVSRARRRDYLAMFACDE